MWVLRYRKNRYIGAREEQEWILIHINHWKTVVLYFFLKKEWQFQLKVKTNWI